jgi:mannose-1-phosphate guanylyltransferase
MTPDLGGTLWGVVLAGGAGRRLLELTRAIHGEDLPKQFAVIDGRRSLLQETLERIGPIVPPSRTVVVVRSEYEALARRQAAAFDGIEIVAQPLDRDTGPGVLLPLAQVLARDPEALLAVFPSDHHVEDPAPFLAAVQRAAGAARRHPMRVFLLGAVPSGPEVEYGWIVPDPKVDDDEPDEVRRVLAFVEKPPEELARRLHSTGALWNTFVMVGTVPAYWNLARHLLPDHAAMFTAYAAEIGGPREAAIRDLIYRLMKPANFSRSILERTGDLGVVRLEGSGWTDWGTTRRVLISLEGTPAHPALLRCLAEARRAPAATGVTRRPEA